MSDPHGGSLINEIQKLTAERDALIKETFALSEDRDHWKSVAEKAREALECISKNSCCQPCREAGLFAKSALAAFPSEHKQENGTSCSKCGEFIGRPEPEKPGVTLGGPEGCEVVPVGCDPAHLHCKCNGDTVVFTKYKSSATVEEKIQEIKMRWSVPPLEQERYEPPIQRTPK